MRYLLILLLTSIAFAHSRFYPILSKMQVTSLEQREQGRFYSDLTDGYPDGIKVYSEGNELKKELETAARKALREIECNQSSALAIALSNMNMPKIHFTYRQRVEEFNCTALFDETRNLIEIELRHEKLTGKITFNKR